MPVPYTDVYRGSTVTLSILGVSEFAEGLPPASFGVSYTVDPTDPPSSPGWLGYTSGVGSLILPQSAAGFTISGYVEIEIGSTGLFQGVSMTVAVGSLVDYGYYLLSWAGDSKYWYSAIRVIPGSSGGTSLVLNPQLMCSGDSFMAVWNNTGAHHYSVTVDGVALIPNTTMAYAILTNLIIGRTSKVFITSFNSSGVVIDVSNTVSVVPCIPTATNYTVPGITAVNDCGCG